MCVGAVPDYSQPLHSGRKGQSGISRGRRAGPAGGVHRKLRGVRPARARPASAVALSGGDGESGTDPEQRTPRVSAGTHQQRHSPRGEHPMHAAARLACYLQVKKFAAEAMGRACKSAPARRLFFEQGAVKVLVGLMGEDSPLVCVAGCHALSALTQLSLAKEQLGHEDVGGLSALVGLLSNDSLEQEGEVKAAALSALCEATLDSSQNKSKLCGDLRGLEVLVPLLSHLHCPVQTRAAAVLENFSLAEGYRLEILQLGAVRVLVEELSSSDKKVAHLVTYLWFQY